MQCDSAYIEPFCHGKSLAVVQCLEGRDDIDIPLHEFRDFDEVFPPLEAWTIRAPRGLERPVRGLHRAIDIGRHPLGDGHQALARRRVGDTVLRKTGIRGTRNGESENEKDTYSMVLAFLSTLVDHSPSM